MNQRGKRCSLCHKGGGGRGVGVGGWWVCVGGASLCLNKKSPLALDVGLRQNTSGVDLKGEGDILYPTRSGMMIMPGLADVLVSPDAVSVASRTACSDRRENGTFPLRLPRKQS